MAASCTMEVELVRVTVLHVAKLPCLEQYGSRWIKACPQSLSADRVPKVRQVRVVIVAKRLQFLFKLVDTNIVCIQRQHPFRFDLQQSKIALGGEVVECSLETARIRASGRC
jgi:hypothetical protein